MNNLYETIQEVVNQTAATDMHTHLYDPAFGELLLSGIDEQLTYHYLVAEVMRSSSLSYEDFWRLSKEERAEHIWQTLFVEHTPLSEATQGVISTLRELGLDTKTRDLSAYRKWYATLAPKELTDLVFKAAGVAEVLMTNDPFDEQERCVWLNVKEETVKERDKRFKAAMRIDTLLNDPKRAARQLEMWGVAIQNERGELDHLEVQRFLLEWAQIMNPVYLAVSLPPDFKYPNTDIRTEIIDRCVIPVCNELNVPLALMIGVQRQVNPQLKLAGDVLGRADVGSVMHLCQTYPNNRFLVTMLSRENQHELIALARKFQNLMIFGAWWFVNTPSLFAEITTMRFELLGNSFIPQHSDARVLDQLIYKWRQARSGLTAVLYERYQSALNSGWQMNRQEIERDVADLLGGNFWRFIKGT